MHLWTWHKPDFSLLDGQMDHEQSEYVQTVSGIREAYHKLSNCLSTDQFIWCYTMPNQRIITPHHSEVEWILKVPPAEILAFINDIVWNRILNIRCTLPDEFDRKWKNESLECHPYDSDARKKFVKLRRDEFWNQIPPLGDWWSSLFAKEQSSRHVSVLIPYPVRNEWVVSSPAFRSG